MFDVQIDLPYTSTGYINDLFLKAKQHNVSILLSKERSVQLSDNPNSQCNGYFDGDKAKLAVACGNQPFEVWFPILVHESCHMDQWIEKCPAWINGYIGGVDSTTILDLWVNHHIELTDDQLWKVIDMTREVERDCEARVIEKALQYGLPMDIIEHAKKGNSYVYFYNIIGLVRKWYEIGSEPYSIPAVWNNMPPDFNRDYTKIPHDVFHLYRIHMMEELNYINMKHPRLER
jgi:hypothetical protein